MKKTMFKILNPFIALRSRRISQSLVGILVLGALSIMPVARMATEGTLEAKNPATSSLPRVVAETSLAELADLKFYRVGVLIGGKIGDKGRKIAEWGKEVTLTKADSFLQSGNKLAFNLRYFFGNASQSETTATFINRIRSGNEVISQQTNLVLKSGENKMIDTQCYLTPGRHIIYLTLDDDKVVKESSETNNVQRFVVIVSDK